MASQTGNITQPSSSRNARGNPLIYSSLQLSWVLHRPIINLVDHGIGLYSKQNLNMEIGCEQLMMSMHLYTLVLSACMCDYITTIKQLSCKLSSYKSGNYGYNYHQDLGVDIIMILIYRRTQLTVANFTPFP